MFNKLAAVTVSIALLAGGVTIIAPAASAFPDSPLAVDLGVAADYSLLASDFTISGATGLVSINGDYGRHNPAAAATFAGAIAGNARTSADAQLAFAALGLAKDAANGLTPTVTIETGITSIGYGQTRSPGVYKVDSALGIIGNLTLDGGGNPNAVFIFNINGALDIAANASITLTNGTQVGNVFWNVNGGLTLNAATTFKGTAMLEGVITATTPPTNIDGRLLAMGFATLVTGIVVTNPAIVYTAPTPPLNVVATTSSGAVTVSWSPPSNNGGQTVNGYTVTASSGDATSITVAATSTTVGATSTVFTGLSASISYTFTVTAANIIGISLPSSPSTGTGVNAPSGLSAPSAVLGVRAYVRNGRAVVMWRKPVSTGGAEITTYSVVSSDGKTASTSGRRSVIIRGLLKNVGVSYSFTVTAANPQISVASTSPTYLMR